MGVLPRSKVLLLQPRIPWRPTMQWSQLLRRGEMSLLVFSFEQSASCKDAAPPHNSTTVYSAMETHSPSEVDSSSLDLLHFELHANLCTTAYPALHGSVPDLHKLYLRKRCR